MADLLCTMTVIDMSYNSPGLRVLFFAPEVDMMPRVRDLGDVIRFHRVQVGQLLINRRVVGSGPCRRVQASGRLPHPFHLPLVSCAGPCCPLHCMRRSY